VSEYKVEATIGRPVGIVEPERVDLIGPDELVLEGGKRFGPVTVQYETYGKLNADRSNAVLIVHALSGDANVAGLHHAEAKPGWWDPMIGPGRWIDTDRYFVLCSNSLGGCQGTTGPNSIDPATGKHYGLRFPVITVEDMVNVQARLLDHLGIEKAMCVIGGSMGGMKVMQWATSYPERIASAVVIGSTARLSPQSIAFNAVGRHAIMSDPNFNGGDYYDGEPPAVGLAIARMIGHITYLSDESMHGKFGRTLKDTEDYRYEFGVEFEVESYLRYQGERFIERFDPNSYLYISKAMDYFDLPRKYGSLREAFEKTRAKFLVVSYSSDWLFPTYQSKEIVAALTELDRDVTFIELVSAAGHDSFLVDVDQIGRVVKGFLVSAEDSR
jgi:homoserine O-acetyltransferase